MNNIIKKNNILFFQIIIVIIIFIILLFYVINRYLHPLPKINEYYENSNNGVLRNLQTMPEIMRKLPISDEEYILPRVIYGYWDNLEGNDIIQAHINTWYRNVAPDWKVEFITKKNIHEYVDSDFLEKFKNIDAVRFSDFLRVYLLSKNGGVWMDGATIMINGGFLEKYRDEMIEKKADILIYEFSDHSKPEQPYLENWFLMAPKNSLFITDLYSEFTKSHDMGYLKYKNEVLAPKISFENSMGDGSGTYHMQHGIIHYLLKENNNKNNNKKSKYNMIIKDANESMFKAQKINNWESDKLIRYIIDNDDWSDYYAIKLVKFNRKPIENYKEEFINKLNNL
jgi:hypothetical protein